jgi:biotin carboxyl carrier protein
LKFRARFSEGSAERMREVDLASETGSVEVTIDGATVHYDVVPSPAGGYSIVRPDGRQAEVVPYRDADGAVRVRVGSELVRFELLDELTALVLSASGTKGFRAGGDLKAAIPGRVLRILIQAGERVTAGQPLVVLEAMKMENDVKSPRDATVRSVEVTPGQAVGAGEVLVRFQTD